MRLSPIACRVLGSLVEKSLTTPNQYPLSIAALQTACNQRSSRDPVMDLAETDVQQGLRELREHGLARTSPVRGRVSKYEHQLDVQLNLDDARATILGVLLLRGPQTVGEIRTRTDRWHGFDSLEQVEELLTDLAQHPFFPLVAELEREPGRRETRWTHLLLDPDAELPEGVAPTAAPVATAAPIATAGSLTERVAELEARLEVLTAWVEEIATAASGPLGDLGTAIPPRPSALDADASDDAGDDDSEAP